MANSGVALFDPAYGTLTSVQLDFSGSSWGTLSVEQKSANVVDLSSSFGAQITLADALQNPILTVTPLNTFSHHYLGKETVQFTVASPGATQTASTIYTADLSRWTGLGFWNVTAAANEILLVDRNNLKPTSSTQAGASLTVVYNYTPGETPEVPEPGAFLLIGSGLIGVCMLLRKRSA